MPKYNVTRQLLVTVLLIEESLEQVTRDVTSMSHKRDLNACKTVEAKFGAGNSYQIDKTSTQLPSTAFNPINAELNLTCHLLVLLGAHPILHVSKMRVK